MVGNDHYGNFWTKLELFTKSGHQMMSLCQLHIVQQPAVNNTHKIKTSE
jgi:hypothetical protein